MKLAETLFDLPSLASLPDEAAYMPRGPRDGDPAITNLLGAFDPARLAGRKPPIPAAAAEIPDASVNTFPAPMNCRSLGIAPVRLPNAGIPANFDPRPHRSNPDD